MLVPPMFAFATPRQHSAQALNRGTAMASETEWLDDVRRWYFGGTPPETDGPETEVGGAGDLGYEAAHPALVARHWPDAAVLGIDPA